MISDKSVFLKDCLKYSVLFGLAILLVVLLKIFLGGNFQDVTLITFLKGALLLVITSALLGVCGAFYELHSKR